MHIANSYIIEQPWRTTVSPVTTLIGQDSGNKKTQQAQDTYRKNAANGQIIEAEYVDYPTKTKTLNSQPSSQQAHPIFDQPKTIIKPTQQNQTNLALRKYQAAPLDTPPPGTYLNTFA